MHATRLRWVNTTPWNVEISYISTQVNQNLIKYLVTLNLTFTTFGVPVDPEVYMTMAVSSGVGDAVEGSLLSTGIVESIFAPWKNFISWFLKFECISEILLSWAQHGVIFYVIVYLSNNTSKGNELNAFLVSDQACWLQLIFKENDASDVWQLGREKNGKSEIKYLVSSSY